MCFGASDQLLLLGPSRLLVALGRQSWGRMRGSDDDAPPPRGSSASIAERIARGIVPKWTNVNAANRTMEFENALLGMGGGGL